MVGRVDVVVRHRADGRAIKLVLRVPGERVADPAAALDDEVAVRACNWFPSNCPALSRGPALTIIAERVGPGLGRRMRADRARALRRVGVRPDPAVRRHVVRGVVGVAGAERRIAGVGRGQQPVEVVPRVRLSPSRGQAAA